MLSNLVEEGIRVFHQLVIREADDPEAEGPQVGIAVLVMGLLSLLPMDSTIELQDQPSLVTVEICDVRSDRHLPAEFQAEEFPVAQPLPKRLFGRRGFLPEPLRTSEIPGVLRMHTCILYSSLL